MQTCLNGLLSLRAGKSKKAGKERSASTSTDGFAGRATTELVAGVVVGTFMGWALDNWLGTTPTLMVVFFYRVAAGMLNAVRALTGGMAAGFAMRKAQKPKITRLMSR